MTKKKVFDGFTILQVGRTKSGKTTESKEWLERLEGKLQLHVYDVNNEYSEFLPKNYQLPSFKDFVEKVYPITNSFILFEEASIFFTPKAGLDIVMRDKLVRKRHQHNIIMLNFHSWGMVPKDIVSMCDIVIVRKTNDSLKKVEERCDDVKLLKAFEKVKNSDDNYKSITVNLYA